VVPQHEGPLVTIDADIRAAWIERKTRKKDRYAGPAPRLEDGSNAVDRLPADWPAGRRITIVLHSAFADHIALAIDCHDRRPPAEAHALTKTATGKDRPVGRCQEGVPRSFFSVAHWLAFFSLKG